MLLYLRLRLLLLLLSWYVYVHHLSTAATTSSVYVEFHVSLQRCADVANYDYDNGKDIDDNSDDVDDD